MRAVKQNKRMKTDLQKLQQTRNKNKKTKSRKKKEHRNCPYCSSPNCNLGMKDFFKSYGKK
jgi:hypothetical protein